jgi:transcriptional regulator with XRE-family HTH domain
MNQSRRPFIPTPAYRLFLKSLVQTRMDRGYTTQQLAEQVGLTPAQVASFEAGEHPLGFIDVRNWLLALDMPFTQFTQQMEEVLDSTLERHECIIFPKDEDETSKYARADPLPHHVPNIQMLFFAPGAAPEIRTIANTLEAKQALV